jgi:hypothetical protein
MLVVVAVLLSVSPADHGTGPSRLGRLGTLLTLVPADAASRMETVIEDEVHVGDQIVRAPPEEVDSLAAVDDVRVLANAFDALAVQSAAFSADVFRFVHDNGKLLPYRAVATGATPAFLVIGLAMNDPAGARENATRLRTLVESGESDAARRPWSELVGVDSIETFGRVVLAVLSTKVPTLWLSLQREPDSLLWFSRT